MRSLYPSEVNGLEISNVEVPKLKNIIAVISNKKIDTLIPQFTKKDIDKVAEYILNNSKQ